MLYGRHHWALARTRPTGPRKNRNNQKNPVARPTRDSLRVGWSGFPPADHGVPMIRRAFNPNGGSLADPTKDGGEQEALANQEVGRLHVSEGIDLRSPSFMPVIYLGSRPMLKRAECHQWVDLGPWNDHFNCRGRAFALIPVGTFNHGMAYPLNAKLIRHSFGGHTKTTMFESHKPSRTERNSGPQITIRRGLREA